MQKQTAPDFSVSPHFKKAATASVIAIVGFILVYLALFILATGFVALCFYAGLMVIMAKVTFLTILLGLGIIACGVMTFFFLIKFLFAKNKADNSDSIVITASDHPELFKVLHQLAAAIGTAKPKKVLLSPDVNACVFYASSFWSMFLPVKKNLKIGAGLVNVLNTSELKAVIAHEFGHFSQRSMKVGTWVYQVNRVIYDMLFNNHGFGASLQGLANVHGVFSLFAAITIKIVQGIQWVLQQMYKVVNKNYLELSRQMEFHADLVAASVCGSNNIIQALRQIELAEEAYNATLGLCNNALNEKKSVADFYAGHLLMLQQLGRERQLSFVNGLPQTAQKDDGLMRRVNYKDQWSSHPTLQERAEYLQVFNLETETDTAPAWRLFSNEAAYKRKVTQKLYRDVAADAVQTTLDEPGFEQVIDASLRQSNFPPLYKTYYDNRQISLFDVEAVAKEPFSIPLWEVLFNDTVAALPKKLSLLYQDLSALQGISEGYIDAKSFDFDGQKYAASESGVVIPILEKEIQELEEEIKKIDSLLFRYFYAVAPLSQAEALKKGYADYFQRRTAANDFFAIANETMECLRPVFEGAVLQKEEIEILIHKVKSVHEPALKKALSDWYEQLSANPELKELTDRFLGADYQYFHEKSFFEHELQDLNKIVLESYDAISTFVFLQFKTIVEKQAHIMKAAQGISLPGGAFL